MKKIIIILATALVLSLGANNAIAQNDNYFSDWNEYREGDYDPTAPIIPASHGSEDDSAAPIGSGLLILAGFGVAYAMKKKRD